MDAPACWQIVSEPLLIVVTLAHNSGLKERVWSVRKLFYLLQCIPEQRRNPRQPHPERTNADGKLAGICIVLKHDVLRRAERDALDIMLFLWHHRHGFPSSFCFCLSVVCWIKAMVGIHRRSLDDISAMNCSIALNVYLFIFHQR